MQKSQLFSATMLTVLWLCLSISTAQAATGAGAYPQDPAPVNLSNKGSLQRGAKLYVNYCQGCHSLQFQRYNRLARDFGLSDALVKENLILTANTKIGDTMQTAMSEKDGKNWFGVPPPDLSLIARARGADYLYNYLRAFYVDEGRPFGVNNSVFPLVGMPHVLEELQGLQVAERDESGKITGFKLVQAGSMTPAEYKRAAADLTNFLVYVGEPIQQERKQLGFWVLLYLILALVVFYLLKREYWKDVH